MGYLTEHELRELSDDIWRRIETGEEFVITRDGRPFALLVHTEPQAVEDRLRALRLSRMAALVSIIRHEAQAHGRALTEADIDAEVQAARRHRPPRA